MPVLTFFRALPWRYIGTAIGAALAVWAAYDWAHDRGRDAGIQQERKTWQWVLADWRLQHQNVRTLEAAIAARNAAIDLAAGKTRAAQDAAAEAGKRATERGKALAGAKAAMADASRATGPENGCVVTDDMRKAWGKL